MLSQRWANIGFAILVIAACAYFAIVAEGFQATGLLASAGLPSKFFPQVLLGFTAFCAAIVLYTYVRRGSSGDLGQSVFETLAEARRGLLALAAVIASYVLWTYAGYIAMAAVSGVLMCLAMGVRNPVIYGANLVLAGAIYLVFNQLLGTQF